MPCACRHAVADLVARGDFAAVWREAQAADAAAGGGALPATWRVCRDAAEHVVDLPPEADVPRRVALCFGQQMVADNPYMHPRTQRGLVQQLLTEAGPDEKTT